MSNAIEGLLAAARDVLGMELAYLAEIRETELVLREVDGDTLAYGEVAAGTALPRATPGVNQWWTGEAPQLVRDAESLPQAAAHPFVAATGIRAYAGVPVRRADGSLFGSLCCISRHPQPDLHERDLRYLAVLARIGADLLAAAADAHEHRRAEVESAAGQALMAALNARENYTAEHSEAVLALALEVATELGLDADTSPRSSRWRCCTTSARSGAGRDPAETGAADRARVGSDARASGDRRADHRRLGSLAHLAPAMRAEHERWDGHGYPDGLAGEEVPLASRICFVCDAWHAMTSDRPYRGALTVAEARAELERNAGAQFCPSTTAALVRVLDRGGMPAIAGTLAPPPSGPRCRTSDPTGRSKPSCAR